MSPRILCYAPYNKWAIHGLWEMTILQAAQQRGADVHYVACDGLFSDCDLYWRALTPRPANACTGCQAAVAGLIDGMGMDFRWLGRYLTLDERREARDWARALPAEELATARYGDFEVAEWVRSSVHSDLRTNVIDVSDPKAEESLRGYLFSGLVACFALDRLLDDSRPDVVFLFNGRLSSTRVAMELALRRGIRVVTHEAGMRRQTLNIRVDEHCNAFTPLNRVCREWAEVPLTGDEIARVDGFLAERFAGASKASAAGGSFGNTTQSAESLLAQLGLDPARPIFALYTSSDDESAGEPEWHSRFDGQLDWIQRTVDYAAKHPDLQLVIRVHPNTGSRHSFGANRGQLEEFEWLAERLPQNVRLVRADQELSSYALADVATACIVSYSTIGLEAATKGKHVLITAPNAVAGAPFVTTALDPDGYAAALADLHERLPVGAVSPEVRRMAYRSAYALWFRKDLEFPIIRVDGGRAVRAWNDVAELAPGRDAGVDRAVRILLDAESPAVVPAAEQRARTDADEQAFFFPRRATLAFAGELIADPDLLRAWGAAFSAHDPVTLAIEAPSEQMEALVAAVDAAGLTGEDAADLLAFDPEQGRPRVEAVYSRRPQSGALAALPRHDETSLRDALAPA